MQKILRVLPDSIAEELQIEPGDHLISINGRAVKDIFDYTFLSEDEYLEILIKKKSGEEWLLEIEKDEDESLGLEFESELMDGYNSCRNKCIFCFIDQMPKGMRDTLYFKDDDSRLSFIQGNYVTLTNVSDDDIDRIIRYNMTPINISFQAMRPETRCLMLRNRFAGDILEKTKRLTEGGIFVNGQIVLCKNVNDGEELEYSLEVLSGLCPMVKSVSVVPVGLTKYREGLYPLEPFEKKDAIQVLEQIRRWQKLMRKRHGIGFVYASDEWYLLAEEDIPDDSEYDGYPQLENGVGMLRLLQTEVEEYLKDKPGDLRKRTLSIATGRLACGFIHKAVSMIQEKYPNAEVKIFAVNNEFFGEQITVSGLITGQDLIKQLKGAGLGEKLVIPVNMLRAGEQVFLDDITVKDIERELGTRVVPADADGASFCIAILEDELRPHKRRQIYEQTDNRDSRQA